MKFQKQIEEAIATKKRKGEEEKLIAFKQLSVYERIQDFKRMIIECVIYYYFIDDYNT